MAEVVLAYCSSHAPMMSSAREAAPKEQRDNFLGSLEAIKQQAQELDVQACVFLSNEHFTNFFLENFPQICVGVGERNWGPTEEWLPIDKVCPLEDAAEAFDRMARNQHFGKIVLANA